MLEEAHPKGRLQPAMSMTLAGRVLRSVFSRCACVQCEIRSTRYFFGKRSEALDWEGPNYLVAVAETRHRRP